MFFAASAEQPPAAGLYDLVKRAAAAADRLGFTALWLPERHFHRFGGAYPAPAVLGAALAGLTENIRLRAGSITLPLNPSIRVAEAWAMLDNLSQGRVELGFGSGWSPNDFVLAPDCFAGRKAVMQQRIDEVRRLWRGESVPFRNGEGNDIAVRTYPAPLQSEPPIWISATGNPETFQWAGAQGFNVLTMLLGGTLQDTAERIRLYREARRAAGLDPAGGRVALMLHSLVHPDEARVMDAVREPFTRYVRDALDAQRHASAEGRALDEAQREKMARYATERYTRSAALFGPAANCRALLREVQEAGVDEVACLIDFGPDDALVLEGLPHLAALRDEWNGVPATPPRSVPPDVRDGAFPSSRPRGEGRGGEIAIVGMSGIFPGAPDMDALAAGLAANQSALVPPPAGRYGAARPALALGGFIDAVEWFDPEPFRLAPVEAAAMDPHQRLLLSAARRCLADAGMRPEQLAGSATGVFVALYSDSYAARAVDESEPLAATGRIHALAANRISHAFDLGGPSEVIATACSSGLVAVHRAVRALRQGECRAALVGAASLLLSDGESRALRGLGVLSADGRCRPFDRAADGQARGEGVCAMLLKPLDAALADGDPIHAVILGSATNHNGGASGTLLLPNANRQAACMAEALEDAGVGLASVGYVEAHGAGGAGDHAELAALAELWRRQGEPRIDAGIALASGKAAMGSLDAAGGLAGLARAVLAVRDGVLPGQAAGGDLEADNPIAATPFRVNLQPRPWPSAAAPRRAGVHAYGLGGVNAHVIVQAPPRERRAAPPPPPERPLRFPLAPEAGTAAGDSVVGDFYDYVTRDGHGEFSETYLTLAPFPQPVPGFSWTRTMQEPSRHPQHHRLLLEKQREMRAVAFDPVNFSKVRRMLDIGCGLGTDLIVLAEAHPQLEGVGYTLSPAQARAAQRRIQARGLAPRLTVQNRDSARDRFPGRFELIFGFEVAHHVADKDALFANIAGALAADGHVVLADTVAGTVAPVDLREVGSHTLPRGDYARLFARHGLEIVDCVDLSREIAHFLADPQLDAMLADEARAAGELGRTGSFPLAEAVQRSWDAFGQALSEGLMLYVLIHARPAAPGRDPLAANLQVMETT
ncbi:hypothetical protein MoryE10_19040 [Methylogaea oryzae]|uniref:Ketosynthase family 3 (KS3) domain-containing protein n=2 Tax=Methylogaea oryzae TaxID=1295382 RepID=A0A8D4VNT5_9GAMM|nr:hypothetical protein MoryE10_19040 [Methylogaea oryzae]